MNNSGLHTNQLIEPHRVDPSMVLRDDGISRLVRVEHLTQPEGPPSREDRLGPGL